MQARREFLRRVIPASAMGLAALKSDWLGRVASATAAVADRSVLDRILRATGCAEALQQAS